MRKVFTVMIHDKSYDVFDIETKEHQGPNGEPKTWWVYYSQRLPEGAFPPTESEYLLPFNRSIERHIWDVKITQRNTSKSKWNETQFRSHTWVELSCNGRPIYEFGTTGGDKGLSYAMAKIQYLKVKMEEHSYNFFDPEKETGRKIYWFGLPATIRPRLSMPWEIIIMPAYVDGYTKETWWQELKRREVKDKDFPDDQGSDRESINWGDALSDQHIDWFRKEVVDDEPF